MPSPTRPRRSRAVLAGLCAGVTLLGGCASGPGQAGGNHATLTAAQHSIRAALLVQEAAPVVWRPPAWTATPAETSAAVRLVRRMSLRSVAGQVIVASVTGHDHPARLVRRLHLGGVITMPDDVISPRFARKVNDGVRRVVRRRGYYPLIGIDQEGGPVTRLGPPATTFPAFMAAGAARDTRLTERSARASAEELRRLGFTAVFAPDADVTVGAADTTIGARSAGSSPGPVTRQVLAAVRGIQGAGVMPVLKHFPGHGSVVGDSHVTLPVQTASVSALLRRDLVPFLAGIRQRVPAIMTGHIEMRALDHRRPTSASRKVTTGFLRRRLGFGGLVITDALNMQGIQRQFPGSRASVAALRAGADVLLMPPDPVAARAGIVRAVRSGRLSRDRLNQAAARMIATLMHQHRADRGARPGSGRSAAAALARAAVTSVAGPCVGDRLPDRIRVTGPSGPASQFRRLAETHGIEVQYRLPRRRYFRVPVTRTVRVRVKGPHGSHTVTKRVHGTVLRAGPPPPPPAPLVALIGYGGLVPPTSDVLVAMDHPAALERGRARVKIATFGSGRASVRAAFDVLTGRASARGRLPVRGLDVARPGC